jgi:ABC-3C biological conflict system middle component
MIVPGKHLVPTRALLGVGAEILAQLNNDRSVSELWLRVRDARGPIAAPLPFDWFILALSFLYAVGAVDRCGSVISASESS